jgi:hypothetical protein
MTSCVALIAAIARSTGARGQDEWPFARCLRLAHAEIAGRRDTFAFAEIEKAMREIMREQRP